MEQQKPQFRYYYGDESEQFSFFKIPKLLITHELFRNLSNDAKILYGLLCISSSVFPKNRKEKFPTLGMGYSHISAGNIFI